MLALCLAVSLATATLAARPVWEADIVTTQPSPTYRIDLGDELTSALANGGADFIDVVDADGRTMPRGSITLAAKEIEDQSYRLPLVVSMQGHRQVRAPGCEEHERTAGCALFSTVTLAPPVPVQPRIWINPGESTSAASNPRPLPRIPRAFLFDVATVEVPAPAVTWSSPRLVLRWHSELSPEQLVWQIGRRVGQLGASDRAALAGQSNTMPDAFASRVDDAWRKPGRFLNVGKIDARRDTIGGGWETSIALPPLALNLPIEIGSSPAGAVTGLVVALQAPAQSPATMADDATRPLLLGTAGDNSWDVQSLWPMTTRSVILSITPATADALQDAGIASIAFVLRTAAGDEKAMRLTVAELSSSVPYDAAKPWSDLRAVDLPIQIEAPGLVARYQNLTIWFDNRGIAPYRLRVGARSFRQPEPAALPTRQLLEHVDSMQRLDDILPLATLATARIVGTYTPPDPVEPPPNPSIPASTSSNSSARQVVMVITLVAALLVALLAATDAWLRRRIGPVASEDS